MPYLESNRSDQSAPCQVWSDHISVLSGKPRNDMKNNRRLFKGSLDFCKKHL